MALHKDHVIRDRLMVGRMALNHEIGVRLPVSEQQAKTKNVPRDVFCFGIRFFSTAYIPPMASNQSINQAGVFEHL